MASPATTITTETPPRSTSATRGRTPTGSGELAAGNAGSTVMDMSIPQPWPGKTR
jgi:hypothetical protein